MDQVFSNIPLIIKYKSEKWTKKLLIPLLQLFHNTNLPITNHDLMRLFITYCFMLIIQSLSNGAANCDKRRTKI